MEIDFLETGSCKFTITKNGLVMQFEIAKPFKYGIDDWRRIKNGGIDNNRYEGCKMSSTPSNITLIFYENEKQTGTYQWIRLADGILELGIELERGCATRYSKSIIQIPIQECYTAIDKLIEHYETV
jgi:hypothetical protein